MSWGAPRTDRDPLRIVFAAVGSRGDVQPIVALALHAKARGHSVRVAAPVNFANWVAAFGLEFRACGDDIQKMLADEPDMLTGNTLRMLQRMGAVMEEHAPPQLQQLMSACEGADALVWAGVAIVAPTVADACDVASVNVLYSSCWVPSEHHPPPFIHAYGLPRWLNRWLWAVDHWIGKHKFGAILNPMRRSLGLPERDVHSQFFREGLHVVACDDALFPARPLGDERCFPRANFIFMADDRPLDAELDAWLRDGPPPVFAGFGSMSGRGPQRAMRALVEALEGSGHRCLVGAGWAQVDAGALPAGWRVVGDVPHAQLFPRVALVIHHGGSGTTASVLRAGVPQVILPLLLDQYHHAHMLHAAGMGPRCVAMEKITGPLLAKSIADALGVPREKLDAVAARLPASDAAAQVVDLAEAAIRAKRAAAR